MSVVVDFFSTHFESAAGPFVLVDAGVSGGIDPQWRAFGSALRAIGFDPLVREVQRLTELEDHPGIEYHAAFLAGPEDRAWPSNHGDLPFQRSSAVRVATIMDLDYVKTVFNADQEIVWADDRYSIDEILPKLSVPWVDLIKIDTDGYDFLILCGAEETLDSRGVLGVQIEVQLHGGTEEQSNTFANIDRYLRRRGFRLFSLEVHRYSRAALPRPFVYHIPAQTTSGQVEWGDAVYLRDPVGQPASGGPQLNDSALVRLACMFDLFDLADCTAELVTAYADRFEQWCDTQLLLDRLTPTGESYQAYLERFEADPTRWYPES